MMLTNTILLYPIIPFIIILFLIFRRKYIKLNKRYRILLMLSKIMTVSLLLIAAAQPYIITKTQEQKPGTVTILLDNSSSMSIYDLDLKYNTKPFGRGTDSNIGDAILSNIIPDSNIILVTDGWNNAGTSLDDVMLYAASINSTVYAAELPSPRFEASIWIEGPNKVIADVDNEYIVRLQRSKPRSLDVVVTLDDKIILETSTEDDHIIVPVRLDSDKHVLTAQINVNDAFDVNNRFTKSLNVVDKPELLIIGQKSKLGDILDKLYDISYYDHLPSRLDKYYGIILDNIPASDLSEDEITRLDEYVSDGNGLFVIGGKNSYDYGNYNSSTLSFLLPVGIGEPRKKKDVVNIVLLVDTGASGAGLIDDGDEEVHFIDVQKAIAAEFIRDINSESRVGVIESNFNPAVISKFSEIGPKREQVIEDIARIKVHDATRIYETISNAYNMLKLERGSKNIILITDGNVGLFDQGKTLQAVAEVAGYNVKVYTVGVGNTADVEFLSKVARVAKGQYFQTDESAKLNILFGDPSDLPNSGPLELFIYDTDHFITSELNETGTIAGFNSIYPKTNAQLLLTSIHGDPILVTWRYGLGRVASFAGDNGDRWSKGLLGKDTSQVFVRTLNWIIEDPERKEDLIYKIPSAQVNSTVKIKVIADQKPGPEFSEDEDGVFTYYYLPTEIGLQSVFNQTIAVNYNLEFKNFGLNNEIEKKIGITGGSIIDIDSAYQDLSAVKIVESSEKKELAWAFITAAILVFLIEIIIRKIYELRTFYN